MKSYMYILCIAMAFILAGMLTETKAQTQEPLDIELLAEEEANKYQELLKLEDWQVFYVDSTLKHDFPSMMAEIDKLRNSKVSNMMLFQAVQDKWMDQIDATYKRIFNPQQWAAYLKTGAAKAQKAREKRKAQPSAKK